MYGTLKKPQMQQVWINSQHKLGMEWRVAPHHEFMRMNPTVGRAVERELGCSLK
jgi:hypothetical protein